MEQSQVANYLLLRIKQKLNPGYGSRRNFEQVVYVRERCSVQEYLSMFPQAKSFIVKKTKAKQLSRKFQTHRKLYEAVFTQPQQLNYLFGEDWWFVFNGTTVGAALPTLSFRLNETTINSHQTKLVDTEEADTQIYSKVDTYTILSATIHRCAVSRWGEYDKKTECHSESNWKEEIALLQRKNVKLSKKRNK